MGDEQQDQAEPAESDFGKRQGPGVDAADEDAYRQMGRRLVEDLRAEKLEAFSESMRADLDRQRAIFDKLKGDLDVQAVRLARPPLVTRAGEDVEVLQAMPDPRWETVTALNAVHSQLVTSLGLTRIHLGVAEQSDRRLAELIEALRAGQEAQDRASQGQARSNRQLVWLTRVLVVLTIVLAIPLVLDALDWVGLIAR